MTEKTRKLAMYLDQNALDMLIKKGTDAHLFALKESFNIVYSDGTLREIYKAGHNASDINASLKFTKALTNLGAVYFQLPDISLNTDDRPYECTDAPNDVFLRFLNEVVPFDRFTQPFEKMGLALYNGVKDYDCFGNDQITAMYNLRNFLHENLELLEAELLECGNERIENHLQTAIDEYRKQIYELDSQLDEFQENVKYGIDSFKEANQINSIHKTFQKAYNINIDNLKKIEGDNALNRIFDYIDQVKPKNTPSLREVHQIIFDDNERIFNKIPHIYSLLNLVGYYSDENLNKEKRFLSSTLDSHHAQLGCFCDIFVTHDQKFAKKMKVIYEHFNIGTQIYDIDILENRISLKPLYNLELGIL